jgi:hypothetical protein
MNIRKSPLHIFILIGIILLLADISLGQWESDRDRRPSPRISLGIRGGYDWNKNTYCVGGQLKIPLGMGRGAIQIIPNGDIFFIRSGIDWQLNLDAAIRLMMFYGGAGLAYLNREFYKPDEKSKKTGINYFIGFPLPMRRLPFRIFIEGRWTNVNDETLFRLVVGINFSLGGNRR